MSTDISPLTEAPAARRPSLRSSRLRLVPPSREPEQLPLDLEWEVSPGIPAVPSVSPALRVVGPDLAKPASVAPLPEPGKWAAKLARAIDEVARGERPIGQLTRHVSRAELSRLALRVTYQKRHRSAQAQPRTAAGRSAHTVRAVRVCRVAPGIVETSAVLVGDQRSHAIAIRLEEVGGRWLATAIEMP